jgi:hypothetical protein
MTKKRRKGYKEKLYRKKGELGNCQSLVIRQEPAHAGESQGAECRGKYAVAPGGVAAKRIITNGLIFRRLPGGSGGRPFISGKCPPAPKGMAGFYGSSAAIREAPSLQDNAAVAGLGGKSLTMVSVRRASGLWPGVGRLWAINVTATRFGTKQRPGEGVITNASRGADHA